VALVVDCHRGRALVAGTDYLVSVILRGTTISVSVDGSFALSFSFNSAVVDGRIGTFSHGRTSAFDSFRIRTDDPAFGGGTPPPPPTSQTANVEDISVVEGNAGTTTIGVRQPVPGIDDHGHGALVDARRHGYGRLRLRGRQRHGYVQPG
jgi:hypothetical protein